jgi:hypothetical protein
VSRSGRPPRSRGLAGLIRAGWSIEQAWHDIHSSAQDPDVRAIIEELESTPEGRATLEWSRLEWAQRGLAPPWEVDPP